MEKFTVGAVSIIGPAEADLWWPDCVGSSSNNKWTEWSHSYFEKLTSGKHPYIRGSAPLKQLEIRSWVSKKGRQCYDEHFQDTPSNVAKMAQIVTNLAVLNRMLGMLYEVASQIGLLPNVPAFTPQWISKYSGLCQSRQEGETPGSKNAAQNDVPDEERERQICIKLAMLASLPLPTLGDRYAAKEEEILLYQSDKLNIVAASLEPGKITGPITHYGSYEETCGS